MFCHSIIAGRFRINSGKDSTSGGSQDISGTLLYFRPWVSHRKLQQTACFIKQPSATELSIMSMCCIPCSYKHVDGRLSMNAFSDAAMCAFLSNGTWSQDAAAIWVESDAVKHS